MMSKRKGLMAAGISAAFVSSAALGGLTQPAVVDVDLANNFAQGDMRTARNAPNDTEFIGCGMRDIEDGAGGIFSFAFCQAEDAAGERAFCNTTNGQLIEAMRATSDFSFVTFSWQDDGAGNNVCNRIGFSTQSFYLPDTTDPVDDDDDDDDDDD